MGETYTLKELPAKRKFKSSISSVSSLRRRELAVSWNRVAGRGGSFGAECAAAGVGIDDVDGVVALEESESGLNSALESKCHLFYMIGCELTRLDSQCLEVSFKCSDEYGACVVSPRSFHGHRKTGEGGDKKYRFGFWLDRWVDPASKLAAF